MGEVTELHSSPLLLLALTLPWLPHPGRKRSPTTLTQT